MSRAIGRQRRLDRKPRLRDQERPRRASAAYAALIEQIHSDGYRVENYQFPLIVDERWAGSTLLQRLMGLVDVRTDREVWMLYTSVLAGIGLGLLWSYAPEAVAVAVGSTGGGPDIPGHPQVPALDWDELVRDLRLARHWCDDVYIHSLEGCVRQGFLTQLRSLDWRQAEATRPPQTAWLAVSLRRVLRCVLWVSAHPWRVLGIQGVAITTVASTWLGVHWWRRIASRPRHDPLQDRASDAISYNSVLAALVLTHVVSPRVRALPVDSPLDYAAFRNSCWRRSWH